MKEGQVGEKNHQWKGGRTTASNGYVLVKRPGHPSADSRGYVYEHRLVAEQTLGRPLTATEIVHHRNGTRADNRPENLEVCNTVAEHRYRHRRKPSLRRTPGESNPSVTCACGCGETFTKFDSWGRPRRYVTGHNVGKEVSA